MNQFHFVSALTMGASLAFSGIVYAQPSPTQNAQPTLRQAPYVAGGVIYDDTALHGTAIKVRNVPAAFMAYWLDPLRQPKPIPIQWSEVNGGRSFFGSETLPRQLGNGNGPLDLKLPPDVAIVAAVDPQETLLVKGTDEGIQALRKLVDEIDVALSQAEVKALIIELSPAKLQSLPLVFRDAAMESEKTPMLGEQAAFDKDGNSLHFGVGRFYASAGFASPISDMAPIMQKLNVCLADGSGRLITAPSFTVIDGLTGHLSSAERRPLDFDKTPTLEGEEGAKQRTEASRDIWNERIIFIDNETGLSATPVFQGDLIKLGFRLTYDNTITPGSAVMRSGQTLAVRLPYNNPNTGWPRVAFITVSAIPTKAN